jgi:ADP-heptose:LPS heptosyltransferase
MSFTVFMIDGGAGRAIAAIPALLKYHRLNPDDDFKVLVHGWDTLYWGIQELQDRTFNPTNKGTFENVILGCKRIVSPEPYRYPSYFTQKKSLSETFDEIINETNDHSDLIIPTLVTSKGEEKMASNIIMEAKKKQKKEFTIVIQPYGRGARVDNGHVMDDGSRSFDPDTYLLLAKKLATKYNLIYFGEKQFAIDQDTYTHKVELDLRGWAALIQSSDYFIGCDSVGQYMARCFDIPGTVVFGSTYPINTSFPNHFQIIQKEGAKKYAPIRLVDLDCHLADRYNDKLMDFEESEVQEIFLKIVKDIEAKVKK